jgi:hypothetical protein
MPKEYEKFLRNQLLREKHKKTRGLILRVWNRTLHPRFQNRVDSVFIFSGNLSILSAKSGLFSSLAFFVLLTGNFSSILGIFAETGKIDTIENRYTYYYITYGYIACFFLLSGYISYTTAFTAKLFNFRIFVTKSFSYLIGSYLGYYLFIFMMILMSFFTKLHDGKIEREITGLSDFIATSSLGFFLNPPILFPLSFVSLVFLWGVIAKKFPVFSSYYIVHIFLGSFVFSCSLFGFIAFLAYSASATSGN